jgi:transposase
VVIVPRSPTGEAISPGRRTPAQLKKLAAFIEDAERRNDLEEWRRAVAVRGYLGGRTVISIAAELGKTRGSVNRWLQWYDADGVDGLRTGKAPGRAYRLDEGQRAELTKIIEDGPQAAGYTSGVWTGPMIGDLIEQTYGVRYHNHHVPRLLHHLGFSVQRPRKRLARADLAAQAVWLRKTFPAIKKKPPPAAAS